MRLTSEVVSEYLFPKVLTFSSIRQRLGEITRYVVHLAAMGFADPTTGVGYAYVTSRMGKTLTGDTRDVALREALYTVLQKS